MAEKLFSRQDMQQKLHRSVCSFENVPVFVEVDHESKHETRVTIHTLGKSLSKEVDYTDSRFSYALPLELGYSVVPTVTAADFLSIFPRRVHHEGLRLENIRFSSGIPASPAYLMSANLYDCIKGIHPSFIECLRDGEQRVAIGKLVPFHRYGALEYVDSELAIIHYRGRLLASVNRHTEVVQLLSDIPATLAHTIFKKIGVVAQ